MNSIKVLSKFSWATVKTVFKPLSALGAFHMTIIGGVLCTKKTWFSIFFNFFNYLDNGILQAHCQTGFMGDGAKFDDSNQCKGLAPVN